MGVNETASFLTIKVRVISTNLKLQCRIIKYIFFQFCNFKVYRVSGIPVAPHDAEVASLAGGVVYAIVAKAYAS